MREVFEKCSNLKQKCFAATEVILAVFENSDSKCLADLSTNCVYLGNNFTRHTVTDNCLKKCFAPFFKTLSSDISNKGVLVQACSLKYVQSQTCIKHRCHI